MRALFFVAQFIGSAQQKICQHDLPVRVMQCGLFQQLYDLAGLLVAVFFYQIPGVYDFSRVVPAV